MLSSSLAGLLVAAVPLVGFTLAWRLGDDETLGLRTGGGLVLGLAGVVLLAGFDNGGADPGSVAMVSVVIVGYAVGPGILARTLHEMPTLGVVAASLGLCAVGYAPMAFLDAPASVPSGRVVAAVVALGLLRTALAFPSSS
ncbi:MAG: hypothetical protein M3066_10555 [Actinomycetota bacterium]|nr:hypothetical protein [Actinomycetota bacterium]